MGIEVAGCSMDTPEDQKAFSEKHDFRFPLISDVDGEICRAYGVFKEDWGVPGRATAVIDEDRTVVKTYPKAPLSGAGHAEGVLNDVRELFA